MVVSVSSTTDFAIRCHPLQVREGVLWGCGIDIYLIILGVDFLDLRGGVVLWLRLVCPGRAFLRPWLHRLLEVFKILVSLAINSIVGLRLFTFFADGDGGDVRR